MGSNLRRRVGMGGLLFVALVIVAVAVASSAPSGTAKAAKVVSYYHKHKHSAMVFAYVLEAAVVVGLAFFWYLRNWLIEVGADARLTTLGFAGAIVFGVSGAVNGGGKLMMADAVNHVTPAVLQGLNLVQDDLNTVLGGVGTALFLLATNVAILKSGTMPKWLGWLGIVLGAAALTAFFGPLTVGIWILVAGIVLLMSKGPALNQPAPATT